MLAAVFIPALLGGLATIFASLIGRAIIALGIGFVTYQGISVAIGAMKSTVISGVNALPSDALGLLAYLWVDKALTVIFSAITVAIAMKGIGGSVKRMVLK